MLKKEWPGLKVFAVEPTLSPVLSGGQPGPHPIQGIGAGFIPAIMDTSLLDGVIQVDPADAKEMARRAAREEGMLVGISSGATLAAIEQKLPELGEGARVLGFNYDTGERYLSVPDFLPEESLANAIANCFSLAAALTRWPYSTFVGGDTLEPHQRVRHAQNAIRSCR